MLGFFYIYIFIIFLNKLSQLLLVFSQLLSEYDDINETNIATWPNYLVKVAMYIMSSVFIFNRY